jgi:hypothetical protein
MRAHLLLAAALLASSCGAYEQSPSSTGTTLTRTVVASGGFSGVPPGTTSGDGTRLVPFTIPAGGALEATVDWATAATRFGVAFYPGGCGVAQLGRAPCAALLQGEVSQKPAYIHLHAEAAGAFTLALVNLGPSAENVTYEVTLTR